jgi:erythromycin esterase
MPANTSGFRPVFLVFLLTLAVVLAACTQTAPPAHTPTPSSDPVIRWIQQHAIPLRTTDPGGSNADLASLKQIVGNAGIVGLGEETHGTHEIIDIKARLTEFLISDMGFTTFIMENDWGSSQLLDAYINGGGGNLSKVMSQSLFGSWQTQEYQALFEWMRTYNATPSHTTKIHFLGMDCQAVSQSDFDAVENFLQRVDPQRVTSVQQLYGPIIAASLPNPYATYVSLPASTKQRYQNQAQHVYDLLQAHQQVYIHRSSPQSFALALQNARILVQFTTYLNSQTQAVSNSPQRDTFMAENVAWIHDHDAGSHPKIIVWAHDGHIANNTTYTTQDGRNMGGELRARYKDSYLPIGTTLYQGAVRVYQYPKGVVQTISPPASDTYNYTFGHVGLPLYMLDLRTIPLGPVRTWSQSSRTFVKYGLGGEDLSDSAPLSQWFNVMISLQNTTPSNHL